MSMKQQSPLFENPPQSPVIHHELSDASLLEYPHLYAADEAQSLFRRLLEELPWESASIRIAGRLVPVPRLQCWIGNPEANYGYSGLRLKLVSWPDSLRPVKDRVELASGHQFNAVLANYYRDGRDSVAWHSDDEPELGTAPVVASLSLGVSRPFELRHKSRRELGKFRITLHPGSLLVMGDTVQRHWQHQLPKLPDLTEARINLTFRQVNFRS